MSTVLVTGANGFVASEVIYQLLQQGKKDIGTVRGENRISGLKRSFQSKLKLANWHLSMPAYVTINNNWSKIFLTKTKKLLVSFTLPLRSPNYQRSRVRWMDQRNLPDWKTLR
jgi:hypothetical protein